MTTVIDVADLHKCFRRRTALDGLTMQVEAGHVHGLLGPTGAGKSTALRVLLGLLRPDGGEVEVLGCQLPRERSLLASRVSALVGPPPFAGHLSGRRALHRIASAAGVPAGRAEQALDEAGLAAHADTPVRSYSTGLRQQLALAAALLTTPELLILDNPARGLDPAALARLHQQLRQLAAGGTTVLLASNSLSGVEQLCDAVTILAHGREVAAGPIDAVLADHDHGEFRVRVADQARAVAIIAETGLPVTAYRDHFVVDDLADAAWLSRTLGRYGLWVNELTPLAPSLDRVFRELTGHWPVAAEALPAAVPRQPTATPAGGAGGGDDAPTSGVPASDEGSVRA